MSFGLAKGLPDLYRSIYGPLLVAAFYVIPPQSLVERANQWLSIAKQDDTYYELVGRKRVKGEIKEYQEVFEKLALSCGAVGAFHSTRDIMAQQFKGMARAMYRMVRDLTPKSEPLMPNKEKYHLELGVASYAKEGRISGDSYLCTRIKNGEYMIVLSDRMGKGLRALKKK